jgi:CRISPR system Cascade subunit CasD
MAEPILLLRLEGPLQSWGVRSRWSRRDTGAEPSKSAIIGLLGCAAGIRRPDWRSAEEPDRTLEEWNNALRFGVRIDRPGTIETDYHTVQGHHWQADGKMKTASSVSGAKPERAELEPPHTEVTWRDYIHDAAFLVGLASEDHNLLRQLEAHLKDPKWPLYLGRKACVPTRPVLEIPENLTWRYQSLEEALVKALWSAPINSRARRAIAHTFKPRDLPATLRNWPKANSWEPTGDEYSLDAWIEDGGGDYERQDAIRLNQLRFYDFRPCRRVTVPVRDLEILET